jgi:formylglycine-generating enzyme required for sulfatase activity
MTKPRMFMIACLCCLSGSSALDRVFEERRSTGTDNVILLNGDKLTGTVLNPSYSLQTTYATIPIDKSSIAGISLEGTDKRIERIVTETNDQFSGTLDTTVFVFRRENGSILTIRPEKVQKVVFRVRQRESADLSDYQEIYLKNGDHFHGRLQTGILSVVTSYATMPVRLSEVDTITWEDDSKQPVKISMLNGDIVRGMIVTEDITLALGYADMRITVRIDHIQEIRCRRQPISEPIIAATVLDAPPSVSMSSRLVLSLGAGVDMTFARIPAGRCAIGSQTAESGRDDDEVLHEVTLTRPVYMSTTEVTQAQYKLIMGINPSRYTHPQRPVEQVTWMQASEFCVRLSSKTKRAMRLPTEAEWEYACRAGTQTAYVWGDAMHMGQDWCNGPDLAAQTRYRDWQVFNFNDGYVTTSPVGVFKPNAFGLYDMHGNVWEWCQDWFTGYSLTDVTDPHGPRAGSKRVFRGGAWYGNATSCRSANRNGASPESRLWDVGLRVVLEDN